MFNNVNKVSFRTQQQPIFSGLIPVCHNPVDMSQSCGYHALYKSRVVIVGVHWTTGYYLASFTPLQSVSLISADHVWFIARHSFYNINKTFTNLFDLDKFSWGKNAKTWKFNTHSESCRSRNPQNFSRRKSIIIVFESNQEDLSHYSGDVLPMYQYINLQRWRHWGCPNWIWIVLWNYHASSLDFAMCVEPESLTSIIL